MRFYFMIIIDRRFFNEKEIYYEEIILEYYVL